MGAADQIATAYETYKKLGVIRQLADGANFVPGDGPVNTPLMIVGEAPGQEEDAQGRPFVGPSGQLLDRVLKGAGIERGSCYVTNIVKYRPPRNRTPYIFELTGSRPCLYAEVLAIRPVIILTLGSPALRAFRDEPVIMSQRHGRFEPWEMPETDFRCLLLPLYHPSWVLREGAEAEKQMLADLSLI